MKTTAILATIAALSAGANAAVVQINELGFNTSGVAFNATNQANSSGQLLNGVAFPGSNVAGTSHAATLTYNNLDLDGDASANDSVTFTINVANPGPGLLFNQGFHTNWGTVEGMVVTVSGVSGTTTDNGDIIVFDGFTGAAVGAGDGSGTIDRSVDINGTTSTLTNTGSGSFVFIQDYQDFAPVASLNYTNSGGTQGTLVARNFDLQFSTTPIPEPSSALLASFGAVALFRRRR